jgi:DNA-binding response OmpR family regulator
MPVLFISGYHEREEELRGERLLAKPFSTEELIEAVRSALEDRRREQSV